MAKVNPQDLLTRIYVDFDLLTEDEVNEVNRIDDKLSEKGSISPAEIMELKRLIRDVSNRRK